MSDLTGIVLDLPEATYHAHPSLSSTGARKLLDSPARFHYAQTHPQEHKTAFDLGSAVHSKVLGTGSPVVSLPFDSFRSKEAQNERDQVYAYGGIPMLAKDLTEVDDISEAVLAHPTAKALFEQEGDAEASVFATDPDTGIKLRARFDYLAPVCVDLKTSGKDASPAQFARTVASFGYDVQEGHYTDVYEFATGERRDMVFVVVETAPPHLVAVHQLDRDFRDMGRVKARRARELFAECTESGVWPGYPPAISLVVPPMYAIYDFQDRYES